MPHWKAILDVAGNLVLVVMRTAERTKANVFFLLVFICPCCTHGCLWVRVSVWSSKCKCDSFTHLQSRISFQPSLLHGRAFPVCSVAPCAAHSVSPWCVRSSREALTALSSWWGMLRELEGLGGVREKRLEKEAGWGSVRLCGESSLSSRLYSHLVPQGTTHQLELN